jgi:tetratricopeptide (TPR) repeat protein
MADRATKIKLEDTDPLQDFWGSLRDYIVENSRQVTLAASVAVGVCLLACGWFLYDRYCENKADGLYQAAFMEERTKDAQEAAKQYESLLTQYSGTRAAAFASYRLGNLFLREDKFDEAIKFYQGFINKVPDSNDLKTLALGGMGAAYERKNDLQKALAAYEKALATPPMNAFQAMNYQHAARIYEKLDNKAKSLEYYQKALDAERNPEAEIMIRRKIALLS